MLRGVLLVSATLVMLGLGGLWAFQRPFRQYPGVEHYDEPLPAGWDAKTEWVIGRLMYPWNGWGFPWGGGGDWRQGMSNWTIDYPRSERHFLVAMQRLTRLNARSVEQAVNLDDADQYDWPFLYAVEVGHWALTDVQVKGLREYLLRGGFLMVDDFHGVSEWDVFAKGMQRVFPDRQILDIPDDDAIFHTVFDLSQRYQVPGAQYLYPPFRIYENGGREPKWRGIYDDHGRIMVAICHNMDLGDSWEWADVAQYPAKFSDLGIRIGVNYAIYAMTH
jgi:uncharacterized protein DUF4159